MKNEEQHYGILETKYGSTYIGQMMNLSPQQMHNHVTTVVQQVEGDMMYYLSLCQAPWMHRGGIFSLGLKKRMQKNLEEFERCFLILSNYYRTHKDRYSLADVNEPLVSAQAKGLVYRFQELIKHPLLTLNSQRIQLLTDLSVKRNDVKTTVDEMFGVKN